LRTFDCDKPPNVQIVIASAAKQSNGREGMDCFVASLLAMTNFRQAYRVVSAPQQKKQ
jgi:hypothetical protein